MANNICHNGNQKRCEYLSQAAHPLSVARLGATTINYSTTYAQWKPFTFWREYIAPTGAIRALPLTRPPGALAVWQRVQVSLAPSGGQCVALTPSRDGSYFLHCVPKISTLKPLIPFPLIYRYPTHHTRSNLPQNRLYRLFWDYSTPYPYRAVKSL